MRILLIVTLLITIHKNLACQVIKTDTLRNEVFVKKQLLQPKAVSIGQQIEAGLNGIMDKYRDYESNESVWRKIWNEVETFLFPMFRSGKLIGTKASQAYFITIGLQSMTAQDIASNKKVLIVGYAAVKLAEFEIIRIERTASVK